MRGVRLDSGDMAALSKEVRRILDASGLDYVRIVASGGLDEYQVEELLNQDAPIDSFGVGTKMGVSGDAPWFDMAYKLVKYKGRPVLKLSTGKISLADEKQVFRYRDAADKLQRDVIGLRDEGLERTGGQALLCKVMDGGRAVGPLSTLDEIRERFAKEFASLDDRYKRLRGADRYEVDLSKRLRVLQTRVAREVGEEEVRR